MLKKVIFGGDSDSSPATSLGLGLLRLFVGLALAFGHGRGKLPPSEDMIKGVGSMGFPIPVFFAWAAALAEFAGGILLAMGLATRLAAFFICFTMVTALTKVHLNDPFMKQELAFMYFFISLMFLFRGAGRFSIDALIRGK